MTVVNDSEERIMLKTLSYGTTSALGSSVNINPNNQEQISGITYDYTADITPVTVDVGSTMYFSLYFLFMLSDTETDFTFSATVGNDSTMEVVIHTPPA